MTSVVSLNKKLASLLSRYDWILESSIFLEFCRSHWSDLSKASNETYPSKNLSYSTIVTIADKPSCIPCLYDNLKNRSFSFHFLPTL